jgi:hypothetical protein
MCGMDMLTSCYMKNASIRQMGGPTKQYKHMYITNHPRLDFLTEVKGKVGLYPTDMEGLSSK